MTERRKEILERKNEILKNEEIIRTATMENSDHKDKITSLVLDLGWNHCLSINWARLNQTLRHES